MAPCWYLIRTPYHGSRPVPSETGAKSVSRIGIMQGRLSPPVNGRIQLFPASSWAEEFAKAAEAGLYCIEWIYDVETESSNPLRTDEGLAQVRQLIESSGIKVVSVCADYYMTERLFGDEGKPCAASIEHLEWLINRAARLEIAYVVLPFVDASSLQTDIAIDSVVSILKRVAPFAEEAGLELHVESDLPALQLIDLLQRVGSPRVRANYDIGNSASLGHSPTEELPLLAPWLGSVHVKDRVLGGSTVPLGTGAADLPGCLDLIRRVGFQGPLILQVARGPGGSEVETAIEHRRFVERFVELRQVIA
jgi:L-ribulose-5-phosphate 3-epimerase